MHPLKMHVVPLLHPDDMDADAPADVDGVDRVSGSSDTWGNASAVDVWRDDAPRAGRDELGDADGASVCIVVLGDAPFSESRRPALTDARHRGAKRARRPSGRQRAISVPRRSLARFSIRRSWTVGDASSTTRDATRATPVSNNHLRERRRRPHPLARFVPRSPRSTCASTPPRPLVAPRSSGETPRPSTTTRERVVHFRRLRSRRRRARRSSIWWRRERPSARIARRPRRRASTEAERAETSCLRAFAAVRVAPSRGRGRDVARPRDVFFADGKRRRGG